STTAFAADWSNSLPAQAVDSYLHQDGLRILVAAAGAGDVERDAAVSMLEEALRDASRAKLVMSDDALGDISSLDDAAIVEKAGKMPVDAIAVVRVFPAGNDEHSAVITIYELDGSVAVAFTAATNEPLVAQSGQAGEGVSVKAASAVSDIANNTGAEQEGAQQQYEERFVWFQGMASVSVESGAILSTWSVPYKGKYKEPLNGAHFYSYIDQDDLAKKYKKRLATRLGVAAVGIAAVAGGTVYALIPGKSDEYGISSFDNMVPGLIVAGTGAVVMAGAVYLINPHPVDVSARYRMADEFNQSLRNELGMSANLPSNLQKPAVTMALAPWATPDSAGGIVAFNF
ncbi:MAG: hypothetical protein HN348_32835, partial [Proteobacteria bacterium]|nr:hypothetical protein [Pseudomonadota bacterium]